MKDIEDYLSAKYSDPNDGSTKPKYTITLLNSKGRDLRPFKYTWTDSIGSKHNIWTEDCVLQCIESEKALNAAKKSKNAEAI
jgi:hypothetical protein